MKILGVLFLVGFSLFSSFLGWNTLAIIFLVVALIILIIQSLYSNEQVNKSRSKGRRSTFSREDFEN